MEKHKFTVNNNKWRANISKFYHFLEMSVSDDEYSNDLLLDVLQALFSDELDVNTKLELIYFLQEQGQLLLTKANSIEHVTGSLMNIYNYLQNSQFFFKAQILIAVTTMCVNSGSKEHGIQLASMYLKILIKENNDLHSFLGRTCSECLLMLEESYVGILSYHLESVMTMVTEDQSYARFSHLSLLGCLVEAGYSAMNKTEHDNQDTIAYAMINKGLTLFVQSMMTGYSPAGLLRLSLKVFRCSGFIRFPKVMVTTLLNYCGQSWSLILFYIFLQENYSSDPMLIDKESTDRLLINLLIIQQQCSMDLHRTTILQNWILCYAKKKESTMTLMEPFQTLAPTVTQPLGIFISKLCCLTTMTGLSRQYDDHVIMLKRIQCLFQYYCYSSAKDVALLFYGLNQVVGWEIIREDILRFVESVTIESFYLACNTINFCDALEKRFSRKKSIQLLERLSIYIVQCSLDEMQKNLRSYLFVIEKATMFPDVCHLILIKRLQTLSCSKTLRRCNWHDGNLILAICRNILRSSALYQVKFEIANLLWNIHQTFENVSISDKALLYYLLAGNASAKHVKNILASAKNEIFTKEQEISEEVVIENPHVLTSIKDAKEKLFSFKRLFQNDQEYLECEVERFQVLPEKDLYADYTSFLKSEAFQSPIHHRFCLDSVTALDEYGEQKMFQNVYAVNITVKTTGGLCIVKDKIYCPYLVRKRLAMEDDDCRGHIFQVSFEVVKPRPSIFTVSATFLDEYGQCYTTQLNTFALDFCDFFLPLPIQKSENWVHLFDALWVEIKGHQKSLESASFKSALSIKHVAKFKNDVPKPLCKFYLGQKDSMMCFGIFLPSKSHILLQIEELFEGRAIVHIATDTCSLLENIHDYLASIDL